MHTTKIVIADNDVFFRQGLIFDLRLTKDFKLVDCVSTGIELINLIKKEPVNLVITYAYLPFLSGMEAIGMIRKFNPDINILVYTQSYQHRSL